MRSLTSLTIRNLTAHPLRSVLTALAIMLGVATVLAAAIVGQAAGQSATQLSEDGMQVDLEILSRDNTPFDQAILDTLRASPNIERVSPSLQIEVAGIDPKIDALTLIGVDPEAYQSLHRPELVGSGAFLDTPDSIVLPIALALKHSLNAGDPIRMKVEGGRMEKDDSSLTLTLSGRLKLDQGLTALDKTNTAFAPLEAAQTLAGLPGQIDRVEIALRPGTDVEAVKARLSQHLGEQLAVVRAARGGGVELNTFVLQIGLIMTGGIILFAAGFVILNAFVMSVTGRIRELGALRALGMSRRQTMQLILAEAGVLGLLGAASGIMAGLGLAWGVMKTLGTLGEAEFVVPWWGLLLSSVLGVGITLLATMLPARRAAQIAPIEAVRRTQPAASDNWYLRAGGRTGALVLILMTIILPAVALIGRPNMWQVVGLLGISLAALLTATALLLPALIVVTARLSRPLLTRRLAVPGRLAADSLSRNRLRAALTAGALTAAFTTIIATSGFMTALFEVGLISYFDLLHEDAYIVPNLEEKLASGELSIDNLDFDAVWGNPLDPALLNELEALAETGVVQIERMASAPVQPELQPAPGYPAIFVEPDIFVPIGNFDFFEGDPETALSLMQRGRAVLVQPIVAERFKAGVGDTILVQTPKGEIEVTIAGIGGNGWSTVTFPYQDGETYFNVQQPTTLGILIAEGQDREVAMSHLRAILESYPAWAVLDKETDGIDIFLDVIAQFKRLLNALLLLAVVVAALGVVNTMVINVSERSREIGLLRAVGATQRQIRHSVMVEGVLFGLLAVVIAAIVSLVLLLAMVGVSLPNGAVSLGIRTTWETAQLTIFSALRDMGLATVFSLAFGPLIAALAAYYPAKRAAAVDVITATRSEQVALTKTKSPRRESRRRMARSLAWTMALRSLDQHRTRTVLSVLAVMLGAAIIIAADIISGSILTALTQTEDMRLLMEGLTGQLASMMTLSGVAISLVVGFLIFNAFAMSVTQRRRQIGALRSLGMTRRQVMGLVLAEGLLIGGGGTLLGLLAGPLLGQSIVTLLKNLDTGVINVFGQSRAAWSTYLQAGGLGLGVTLLSVLLPARQATRISPLTALRQSLDEGGNHYPLKWAVVGGLVCGVMALYLLIAPPGRSIAAPWNTLLGGLLMLVWLGCLGLILPALVGGVGRWLAPALARFWRAGGRLMADNLQRSRRRVTLTVAALSIGLALIVSTTGFWTFVWAELFGVTLNRATEHGLWTASAFDFTADAATYFDRNSLTLSPEAIAMVEEVSGRRGQVMPLYYAIVPELSLLGSNYFTFLIDPQAVQQAGDIIFKFSEGDWESAMPLMEAGCAFFSTPSVARKNNVTVGDRLTVQGMAGPVECTLAGVGQPYVGATIISAVAKDSFTAGDPMVAGILPVPGADLSQLEADLFTLAEQQADLFIISNNTFRDTQAQVFSLVLALLNGMLLLAIIAAGLGVVNTTMVSVSERRREFGLLRAVGATRRQILRVVAGEAALMGLTGGAYGLLAGIGLVLILVTATGGSAFGITDLDVWGAAWRSTQPALVNGLLGLIAAPFITAAAAWLPTRTILRGSAIETMQPDYEQAISPRRAVAGFLSRGSIRTRLALGTAVLMSLVLAGLIAVVTIHARIRVQEQMHDALRTMASWNAGMVELSLPQDAETLDLETLQGGEAFGFDAEALLRFERLMSDLTEQGLVDFTIADRDEVVLISLDRRKIGTLAPELETRDGVQVYSERNEGKWLMNAAAPIRNDDGLIVGSIRFTVDAREIQGFLDKLRNALAASGAVIIATGLVISWGLGTPLVKTTRRLSAHAAETGREAYTLFDHLPGRGPGGWLSLRARLTIMMVFILALMVGILELIAIPIERRNIEETLKVGLLAGVEWIGQAASQSFEADLFDRSPEALFGLEEALQMSDTLNLARLQRLTDQLRGSDAAFTALVDLDGEIILSDQLALIGEEAPVPSGAQIEGGSWRGEEVWIISTPLRRGRDEAQIGALRMAIRRERVETFLGESRNLFRLTGLIAVLGGVLLAQAIGGAVTAPVRHLAAGTRRIAGGDLSVQFRADAKDELAMLANAYNQMVIGLREREWLRDMFGRFVSQEVAEAIRSGQVKLEGENRVVSILFCDIRGFTARSEQSTPAEMVALLNEYLPLVVEAARRHGGTVNKFGGDSTLVIYGAPKPLPESAYYAILTALQMRANLARLNQRLAQRGQAAIRIGVGINTGTVLAGAVGPKERQEYTVIGDTVNLASRIEALNKEYPQHDVLISDQTYQALGYRRAEFDFVDLGGVQIRGKVEPVRVWAVVG